MKILVTGSLGFIGSALVEDVKKQGHDVIGYDRNESSRELGYECIVGDILDIEYMRKVIPDELDLIIHLSAEHSDEGLTQESYFEINEMGTENLLQIAREKSISRFLFFSTAAVYGQQSPVNEETKLVPTTDYGKSKLSAEKRVREWVLEDSNRHAIIVRPCVVYGPGNRANIYRLMRYIYHGRFLMVGRGWNIKSVIFLSNLVAAIRFLLKRFNEPLEIFNLSDYPQLTLNELVNLIKRNTSRRIPPIKLPLWLAIPGVAVLEFGAVLSGKKLFVSRNQLLKFVADTCIGSDRIRQCGFEQPFATEEGIRETIAWNIMKNWRDESRTEDV